MIWNYSLSVWELISSAYYKTFTMMGKYLIRLAGEDNLMVVYANSKYFLAFSCSQCSRIKSPNWPELSSVKCSFHDGSNIRRASRGWADHCNHHPLRLWDVRRVILHVWACDGALGRLWPPVRRISEYTVKCQVGSRLHPTLFILERLAGFALLKKPTCGCKYGKNALKESRQELRDRVKVQQTPWSWS